MPGQSLALSLTRRRHRQFDAERRNWDMAIRSGWVNFYLEEEAQMAVVT